MVFWYIVSTILIVLCVIALMRGVYLLCRGVLQKDIEDIAYAVANVVYVGVTALLFWMIDLALGFDLGWIKIFVAEHADALRIITGVAFLTIGLPLIGICFALIKWLWFDLRKKVSNNKPSSDDDKEVEE